jgi:hypothetical protein
MARTIDHGSIFLPTSVGSLKSTLVIRSPWPNFHHESIQRGAPWSTLLSSARNKNPLAPGEHTLNQNISRSLSAVRRALISTKNKCAVTAFAGADNAFGSEGRYPEYMCSGFSSFPCKSGRWVTYSDAVEGTKEKGMSYMSSIRGRAWAYSRSARRWLAIAAVVWHSDRIVISATKTSPGQTVQSLG